MYVFLPNFIRAGACLFLIAGFPLAHLNLMDYCHVTDRGISHVSHMTSLQVLTLSRTKLTDEGMPYLMGQLHVVATLIPYSAEFSRLLIFAVFEG